MEKAFDLIRRVTRGDVPTRIYGRWGTNYSSRQLDARIDLANEDHCGPCGNYRMNKKTDTTMKNRFDSCSDTYFTAMDEK